MILMNITKSLETFTMAFAEEATGIPEIRID